MFDQISAFGSSTIDLAARALTSQRWGLVLLGLALTACTNLDRHPLSGYSSDRKPVVETYRAPPTSKDDDRSRLSTKTRLKQLENGIRTKKEMDQYSRVLPYLKNENERIEFLELADFEVRQKWMNQKNFMDRSKLTQENMQELIDAQDIAVGMPQTLVKKAWGDPEHIEVSGNPQFRNERWRYSKYVSTPEGYKLERKSVYFEGGRVAGWEVE